MKTKQVFFGLALVAGLVAQSARAETYNFIFDNSTKAEVKQEPQAESNFDRAHRFSAEAGAFAGTRDAGTMAGLQVGANFALSETLRLDGYFGKGSSSFGGGELQVAPLHVAMGKSLKMMDFGLVGDNPGSIYAGPMVSARVSKACSIIGAVRANLGSVAANAGVAIRL